MKSCLFALCCLVFLCCNGETCLVHSLPMSNLPSPKSFKTPRSNHAGKTKSVAPYFTSNYRGSIAFYNTNASLNSNPFWLKFQRLGRLLSQDQTVASFQNDECILTPQQLEQFYNPREQTWILNNGALQEIGDNIQIVVNCSTDGDLLLFDTRRVIRPPQVITINKRLVISVFDEDSFPSQTTILKTRRKASFTCPSTTESLFEIRHPNVTVGNIAVRDCNLTEGSTIVVPSCTVPRQTGTIRLYHVRFQNNASPLSVSIFTSENATCSALEFVNVTFQNNSCGDQGCVRLSSGTILQNVDIDENSRSRETSGDVFVFVGENIRIAATNITFSNNNCGFFFVSNSSMELVGSSFVGQLNSPEERQRNSEGGVLKAINSTIFVNTCSFSHNHAQNGGVIFAEMSVLRILRSNFTSCVAHQGGVLNIQENSTLTIRGSQFLQNNGSVGSSVHVQNSAVALIKTIIQGCVTQTRGSVNLESCAGRLRNCTFLENQSVSVGGGMSVDSSNLTLQTVHFISNGGADSGGLFVANGSIARLRGGLFFNNSATTLGGGIFISSSQLIAESMTFEANSATAGGSIFLTLAYGVQFLSCLFQRNGGGEAGGGIYSRTTTLSIIDSSFLNNSAMSVGGAVALFLNSNATIFNSNFTENSADDGSAIGSDHSEVYAERLSVVRQRGRVASGVAVSVHSSRFVLNQSEVLESVPISFTAFYARDSSIELMSVKIERNHGCGVVVLNCNATFNNCSINHNSGVLCGAVNVQRSAVRIYRSTIHNNRAGAQHGGGLLSQDSPTEVEVVDSSFRNNSAVRGGGGIHAFEGTNLVVNRTSFVLNTASERGGGISCFQCNFSGNQLTLIGNRARLHGGGLDVEQSRSVRINGSVFLNNSCSESGGGASVRESTQIELTDIEFNTNSARLHGGGLFVFESNFSLNNALFVNNSGGRSGGLQIARSQGQILNSSFERCQSAELGGGASIQENSNCTVLGCTFLRNDALEGGAVSVQDSSLTLFGSRILLNQAAAGGGIFANQSSHLYFVNSTFRRNQAFENGGAINLVADDTRVVALQIEDSTLAANQASLGGALHFERRILRRENCTSPDSVCSGIVLLNTTFIANEATVSGSAIQSNNLTIIRLSCTQRSRIGILRVSEYLSLPTLTSGPECFSSLTERENSTNEGSVRSVGSYVQRVNVTVLDENHVEQEEASLRFRNIRSGSLLPSISLEAVDELSEGPAFPIRGHLVATLSSVDRFFPGEIPLNMSNGTGTFTDIRGFRPPGNYTLKISFNEEAVADIQIVAQIRNCIVGEHPTSDRILCEECDFLSYNFDPTAQGRCTSCPNHANCTGRFILPNSGYWHASPCSTHIQECLNEAACDLGDRAATLSELVQGLETCDVNQTFLDLYASEQCRKGYAGLLCGNCGSSYGRYGLFSCGKCLHPILSVTIAILGGMWLMLLAGIVIRGSLPSVPNVVPSIPRVSRARSSRETMYTGDQSVGGASVPVNFAMVEMMITGRITPENRQQQQESINTFSPAALQSLEESKRLTAESFKASQLSVLYSLKNALLQITVNYLQVTAIAASINVVWTGAMSDLLRFAENLGGITTDTITGSVDCAFSMDSAGAQSLIRVLISIFVPAFIVFCFSILWTTVAINVHEKATFILKRTCLSAVVVLYIAYLGITKIATKVFYCVDINDQTEFGSFSMTSSYWAIDTRLRCYEGYHLSLVLVGTACTILVTIGLPILSALLAFQQRKQRSNPRFQQLFDIFGFLYKAFDEKFVYWESVVLGRKALLSTVAVFSYSLGGEVQSILASFILVLALFAHMATQPYKQVFSALNTYEAVSLLVSCITFIMGHFFEKDHSENYVRIALSVFLFLINVSFFLFMVTAVAIYGTRHIKALLLDDEILTSSDTKWWTVLGVYICTKFSYYKNRCLPRTNE